MNSRAIHFLGQGHFPSCMAMGSLLKTNVETKKFSFPKVLILGSPASWGMDHLQETQPEGEVSPVSPNRDKKSAVVSLGLLKFASGFFEGKPRRNTTNKHTSQKSLRATALLL
ncbi:MAG TPA: hypothetical protein VFC44_04920 [Candidatus Saccharimonadales bacterium]|nr:hypothetical protein [Candidatus Saccharimonadales bacterium]